VWPSSSFAEGFQNRMFLQVSLIILDLELIVITGYKHVGESSVPEDIC
jgi:hypothetical protein